MNMRNFHKLVYTQAGLGDSTLAIAACRAGGIGIFNAELEIDASVILQQLDKLAEQTRSAYGLKLDSPHAIILSRLAAYTDKGLQWLILDERIVVACQSLIDELRHRGVCVLAETSDSKFPDKAIETMVDGLVLKGNESGGFVGENSAFILLQKWYKQTALPLYVRGGVTPYVAAASSLLDVAGCVLDNQLLLLDESPLASSLKNHIENLSGNETVAVGDAEQGHYFRLLVRPGYSAAQAFARAADGQSSEQLHRLAEGKVNWKDLSSGLLPVGQDVYFSGLWRKKYGHMAAVFSAIDAAIESSLSITLAAKPVSENTPLARDLGITYPLVQGPMTRVSDKAEFALAVSEGGAMPMLAFALLKGRSLTDLLDNTHKQLGDRPWGVGLLGFAPQALLDEQIAATLKYRPACAIIAGGRPDQVVKLEAEGIPSFLHVPSANLISFFLQEGARRFIFEGRECGGHIGPLSSFVLWSAMVDRLLDELSQGSIPASDIQVLFAGGIHDAVSSAMVQVLAAPLVARGVNIGILMGSGYLFTKEIVTSGAIVSLFQKEVVECDHTVNLESGPGHASRCAYTPFARAFFQKSKQLRHDNVAVDEGRKVLDDLIMGRLRIASKGCAREGENNELRTLDESRQQQEGMYMLGQLVTLRNQPTDIASFHREVTSDAAAFIEQHASGRQAADTKDESPVDVAIVGIASLLPGSNLTQDYWENILSSFDAITEIPIHRWDWRLYYDEDRQVKDKIYSKWGGFIDDMAFDPTQYGMPPKSIKSVDPMQLMALEVARRTIEDAGYENKYFNRERVSVIIGASGGAGDVGMQYGLRSELPRFQGSLPDEVANRLPEWTEDSFAGILMNVVAGRIANRLDLGGVNFTTDAACASSLSAVYQGVSELVAGRSDMVIAGGVDTVQGPFGYLCFSKTQALSPRGRCRTFDESSDGIVISEGIAMIAIKRLADAERDGDRIYSVIKGVGGSSDGKAKGLTAPLPAGQLRAMQRAYDQAGFSANTIGLFEAHGTGTVAGDTAELESTTLLVKGQNAGPHSAVVGSVKTMIGHTKASAGIVGLIKASLSLYHKVLPPHFGVDKPNHVLQQADCPLYLIDTPLPWLESSSVPRRAAVSAFGFGGTNFHVALEEYSGEYRDWLRPAPSQRWPAEICLWHADKKENLISRLETMQHQLAEVDGLELRDIAYSLASSWKAEGAVASIVATDTTDLQKKIGLLLDNLRGANKNLPAGLYHNTDLAVHDGKLAVLFSGQGSQYTGMMRELALYFPVFADVLSKADQHLSPAFDDRFGAGTRLSHFIFPRGCYSEASKSAATKALTSTDVAQPALGAVEAGLWSVMQDLGLQPDMLAGHSYGEFVALYAGGYFDFDVLMSLSEARGRFIVDAAKDAGSELGTMAAVQAGRDEVEKCIAEIDDVIVANHNSPQQSIISGAVDAVKTAVDKLSEAGVNATMLPVAAAFHSRYVEPAKLLLGDLIKQTNWSSPVLPVYSNTTAKSHLKNIKKVKESMTEHLVSSVEFVNEIDAMYKAGARIFVELGPKPVLSRLAGKILEGRDHKAIALDDNGSGLYGMLSALGQLMCAGVSLDIEKLFERRACKSGDANNLLSLQRNIAIPKHAWMLNGSGVRRSGEPVHQVGLRKEDISDAPVPQEHGAGNRISDPGFETNPGRTNHLKSNKRHKERLNMGARRTMPGSGDPSVMTSYFDTMRQFLETQERVMEMYMGGSSAGRDMTRRRIQQPSVAFENKPNVTSELLQNMSLADQLDIDDSLDNYRSKVEHVKHDLKPIAPPEVSIEEPAQVAGSNDQSSTTSASADEYSRERINQILLDIVEDKTGYPKDMVDFDQNLEADLGVDSIKRIEIVGALLQTLPEQFGNALGDNRTSLNTQSTLNGMLNILTGLDDKGTALPFDQAGAGEVTKTAGHPPRYIVEAIQEPVDTVVVRHLNQGHFIITEDGAGIARKLVGILSAQDGCTVSLVAQDVLAEPASLLAWCDAEKERHKTIAGILHLAQVSAPWLAPTVSLADWSSQLQVSEKSFYTLLHAFSNELVESAHIVSVSALGGLFNRSPSSSKGLSLQAGSVGLLKSLKEERPAARIKAVDLDLLCEENVLVDIIYGELLLSGGRIEVGYPSAIRTVFKTFKSDHDRDNEEPAITDDIVVLATGGAKGVTAEVLRGLARKGNTLLLTGRSALSEDEDSELRSLSGAIDLRQYFIKQVQAGVMKLSPAEIQRKVQSVLSAREMRNNIADFRQQQAKVEYFQVDVTNEEAMHQLMDDIYQRYGALHGVVHGAGVIEDKLLADKQSESWSRVVETKVNGLFLLQKYLRPESLKFLTVFSSVAGRYGNSGQTDYATANELMNRLCCQLNEQWDNKVKVKALCWGPWGKTRFGEGMVTPETEAKFAQRGVLLVSAEEGRQLFVNDLTTNDRHVEIICGEGPWEQQEESVGYFKKADDTNVSSYLTPLLGNAERITLPKGDQIIEFSLDDNHAYLQEHCIDEIPVVPAAVALEIMSEAAAIHWPGWKVAEIRDFKLLKGIDLKNGYSRLSIIIAPPPYGSSEGFEVTATIQSTMDNSKPRIHYRAIICLEQVLPQSFERKSVEHTEQQLSVSKAYSEWLFHGPKFQVIEKINGMSVRGVGADVKASRPDIWLNTVNGEFDSWIFDPAIVDAAPQMAILWARMFSDQTALPARFGRVVRYCEALPEQMHMEFECLPSSDTSQVRANIYYTDSAGKIVLLIEDMECISSAELNRLGGTITVPAEDVA